MQNRNDQAAIRSNGEDSLPIWRFKLVLASVLLIMTIALVSIILPLLTATPQAWAHVAQQTQSVVVPSISTPSPSGSGGGCGLPTC